MQIVQYKAKTETILWSKGAKLFSDGVNIYGDKELKEFIVGLNSLKGKPQDFIEAKKSHEYTPLMLKHYIDNIHVVAHLNHAVDVVSAIMRSSPVTPNQMMNIMLKTAFVFYYANRFSAGDVLVYTTMGDKDTKMNKLIKYDYDESNIRLVFDSGQKVELSSVVNVRIATNEERGRYLTTLKKVSEGN